MGYGKNLKKALDEKKMTVRELSRLSNVSATTLYSIIDRDTAVRFDWALRISNILEIPIESICKENPYEGADEEILPGLLSELNGLTTKTNIKSYLKNRTLPILIEAGYQEMPNIDRLLVAYCSITDEGRKQLFDYTDYLMTSHKDDDRAAKMKKIGKNSK